MYKIDVITSHQQALNSYKEIFDENKFNQQFKTLQLNRVHGVKSLLLFMKEYKNLRFYISYILLRKKKYIVTL